VLGDLKDALTVLPPTVNAATPNRPSRPAALAMLARVYLVMNDYDKAFAFADSSIQASIPCWIIIV